MSDNDPVDHAEEDRKDEEKRKKAGTRKRRGSVSAPPTAEIDVDLKLRWFEKDAETLAFLQNTLSSIFIFQEVQGQDQVALAHAFEEMRQPAGYTVMSQGDPGDNFYCLRSGTVDIYVTPKPGAERICVLTIDTAGKFFGELALMYQAPRAATVVCRTDCVFEALDGTSFNTVLRRSGRNRRQEYHSFLREVPLLDDLLPDQIGKIADVLVQTAFKDGDHIIRQGDTDAETFFIVFEGHANAILDQENGPSKKVKSYSKGDYFGELALIKTVPRAANVVADGDCTVVSIDRAAFTRLLGSRVDKMRTQSKAYSAEGEVVVPGEKKDTVAVPNEHAPAPGPDPNTKSGCGCAIM
mmetsp:Transcript_51922/g.105720  ORF Transcript_51922/g.105720 Transcript_51922/m.105720 type:complete len:353 (+) Transcript_51922:273-1331(+)